MLPGARRCCITGSACSQPTSCQRQNFFGAEIAVVAEVGNALIALGLLTQLILSPAVSLMHAEPVAPTPTKIAAPASLSWLPCSGLLGKLARIGLGMIDQEVGADRHRNGARRTVVVIGSGMVLVIMAVDHLRRLARVVSGIVPMRRRGDRPEDGSGDHAGHHVGNGSGDHGGGSSRGSC